MSARRRPRSEEYWKARVRYLDGRMQAARVDGATDLFRRLQRERQLAVRRLRNGYGVSV